MARMPAGDQSTRSVSQGPYWCQCCLTFISDLEVGTEGTPSQLTDGTKVGGVADKLCSWVGIQRDADTLEKGADRKLMKCMGKCKVLHLGRNIPRHQNTQAGWVENTFAEKGLGVLGDSKLTLSQPCTLMARKANRPWPALGRAVPASRGRWSFLQHGWGHTWSAVTSSGLPVQERHGLNGKIPAQSHRDDMRWGLESWNSSVSRTGDVGGTNQ